MNEAIFFKTESGKEPVKEWLKYDLSEADRKIIGADIRTVQYLYPKIGEPTVKSLGDGLKEIRSHLTDKKIARVVFFEYQNMLILVHGFIKKSQKIAKTDLELAKTRKSLFFSRL